MYIVTGKHKTLRPGVKLDIDQWLKDGWIIKKGVRFHPLEKIEETIKQVTGLNPLEKTFSLDSYKAKLLLYIFSIKFSGKPLTEVAQYCKTSTKDILYGQRIAESWLKSDLTIINYCDAIEEILNVENEHY